MPWCPKCKRFQEEDDLCVYCWVETVDQLEPESNQTLEIEQDNVVHEVFLLNVADENEANIVQQLLKVNNITSLRKHREIGSYLQVSTGMSVFGMDIFVSEGQFELANEIVSGYKNGYIREEEELNDEKIDEDIREYDEYSNRRRNRMLMILGRKTVQSAIMRQKI